MAWGRVSALHSIYWTTIVSPMDHASKIYLKSESLFTFRQESDSRIFLGLSCVAWNILLTGSSLYSFLLPRVCITYTSAFLAWCCYVVVSCLLVSIFSFLFAFLEESLVFIFLDLWDYIFNLLCSRFSFAFCSYLVWILKMCWEEDMVNTSILVAFHREPCGLTLTCWGPRYLNITSFGLINFSKGVQSSGIRRGRN